MAFHMVVVAFLRCADLMFKAQNLGTVFADGTVIWGSFADLLGDAFGEGFDHFIMVIQISGFNEFNV